MVRGGGDMLISRKEIGELARQLLDRYYSRYDIGRSYQGWPMLLPLDIDRFVTQFLGLKVRYEKLSESCDIRGITAFRDTEYIVNLSDGQHVIKLKEAEIVLADYLDRGRKKPTIDFMRRFTLAHECAHQILDFIGCGPYSSGNTMADVSSVVLRATNLSNFNDPGEWQANALAAELLLPKDQVEFAVWYFRGGRNVKLTGVGELAGEDRDLVMDISKVFGASRTCTYYRLQELGYLQEKKPAAERFDRTEVYAIS